MKNYKFQIPVSLNPQLDTFVIGDTIWIASEIPNKILDLNSQNLISIGDLPFSTKLSIKNFGVEPFEDANLDFEPIIKEGNLALIQLVGTTTYNLDYDSQEQGYKFNLGFIPSKKGLFSLLFLLTLSEGYSDFKDLSDCKEKIESIQSLLNGGGNNNYEFIELSADSLIRTTSKKVFDEFGQYCFYVKE